MGKLRDRSLQGFVNKDLPVCVRQVPLPAYDMGYFHQQVVDNAAAEAEADASPRTVAHRMPVAVQRQPDHSRLLPEARLRPPQATLLVPPGSIRETYVLPAPPDIQLRKAPPRGRGIEGAVRPTRPHDERRRPIHSHRAEPPERAP